MLEMIDSPDEMLELVLEGEGDPARAASVAT